MNIMLRGIYSCKLNGLARQNVGSSVGEQNELKGRAKCGGTKFTKDYVTF